MEADHVEEMPENISNIFILGLSGSLITDVVVSIPSTI
jgi:hypothetical protein